MLAPAIDHPHAQGSLRVSGPTRVLESLAPGSDSVAFASAIAATRLSDGTIAVAVPLTPRIAFFDQAGRLTRVALRKGTGPGEFLTLRWIGQCARDTLFAFEQARVQVLSRQGAYIRTIDAGGRLPGQLFCNRSGLIAAVGAGNWEAPAGKGLRRVSADAWLFDTDGKERARLGTVPVTDAAWNGSYWAPVPLGNQMFMTLDGADAIMSTGESGILSTWRGTQWSVGPDLGRIERRPATADDLEAGISSLLALAPNRNARGLRDQFAALPRHETIPAVSRVVSDGQGRVWSQLSPPGSAPTRLRWFDRPSGRSGDLVVPAALILQEVGRDYLLAIEEMPTGEQRVVEYAVVAR